ncbi:hypothetical protein DKX38_024911 [Salix brachista]|uniref:Phytol kinase n=1 Tax=Salix brachista TaxID=2182728 RepID=A0A5N5JNF3_9ROSI|nr:hypothetical protein DKX38_024911 [Salix brachista]
MLLMTCCSFPSPSASLSLRFDLHNRPVSNLKTAFLFTSCHTVTNVCPRFWVGFQGRQRTRRRSKVDPTARAAVAMLHQDPVVSDLIATGLSGAIALSILRSFEETAKRRIFDQVLIPSSLSHLKSRPRQVKLLWAAAMSGGGNPVVSHLCAAVVIFAFLQPYKETGKHGLDQKLNRKLVHISIGLVFMLCWPMFSSGHRGALLAAFIPGLNIIKMLLIGSGMWKDEATVKSMSRFGDRRELLKGPLYYALTITVACAIYWRTSPVAIAAICNLCAGDGIADIVGRRLGSQKIPYNRNKSIAGSVAMALAGFLASLAFMFYFASFGYVQESWEMIFGFLVVSLASSFVESLPISTELDDNLTVTLTSLLLGNLVF